MCPPVLHGAAGGPLQCLWAAAGALGAEGKCAAHAAQQPLQCRRELLHGVRLPRLPRTCVVAVGWVGRAGLGMLKLPNHQITAAYWPALWQLTTVNTRVKHGAGERCSSGAHSPLADGGLAVCAWSHDSAGGSWLAKLGGNMAQGTAWLCSGGQRQSGDTLVGMVVLPDITGGARGVQALGSARWRQC